MDDVNLARTVTDMFVTEMPKYICTLKQAVLDCDSKNIELHAHSIQGAAANIGTDRFRSIAAAIESAGRSADVSKASRHIPELESQYNVAVTEIRTKIPPIPLG